MKLRLIRRFGAVLLCGMTLLFPARNVFSADAAEQTKAAEFDALFTTVDLIDATIAELNAAMADRSLTSERLTQMYIDRIEAYDQPLGLRSIISLNPNALDDARAADKARADGAALGRLHGIPILIKDNIDVAGMPTTCGASYRQYAVAAEDADVVANLRREGAIILGKTNMSEFAESGTSSVSSIAGAVSNAYDLTRTPAGSSGGSAVAVTCNFCAAALGSDTGSSLRRPASFANIYSFRASYGMVSQDGLYRLNWKQDVIGPMCRSAEDLALLFDVIYGAETENVLTADIASYIPSEGFAANLRTDALSGKRIGYLENSFGYGESLSYGVPLDDKLKDSVTEALSVFESCGAELVDISKLLPDAQMLAYSVYYDAYSLLQFRERVSQTLTEYGIDAVIYVSETDVAEKQAMAYGDNDNPACYINIYAPLGGLPEAMLPMRLASADPENGFDSPLPIGLSIFAPYGNDAELLAIAYAYDAATDYRVQPWTTPALPDEAVAVFAAELMKEVRALDIDAAESASAEALMEALDALEAMEDDVSAVALEEAVRALAAAYDTYLSVPAVQPPPMTEPTAAELPDALVAFAAEEPPKDTKEIFWKLFSVGLCVLLSGGAYVYCKKRE